MNAHPVLDDEEISHVLATASHEQLLQALVERCERRADLAVAAWNEAKQEDALLLLGELVQTCAASAELAERLAVAVMAMAEGTALAIRARSASARADAAKMMAHVRWLACQRHVSAGARS